MLAALDDGPESVGFSMLPDMSSIATRGPITPDHVIRTKRIPIILGEQPEDDVLRYLGKILQRRVAGLVIDGIVSRIDEIERAFVSAVLRRRDGELRHDPDHICIAQGSASDSIGGARISTPADALAFFGGR